MDLQQQINTPEISAPAPEAALPAPVVYGKFWDRAAAAVIDGLVVGLPAAIGGAIIVAITDSTLPQLGNIFVGIVEWIYFATMESSARQATVGKSIMGLKVVDMDGGRITFGRATGRYFSKILSGALLLIGYLMALFTEKNQTLHDKIAGTLVIKK